MTTKDRLVKYKDLKIIDPIAAYQFFLENENDERFTNLIRTGDNLVEFVNDFLEKDGDMLDEKTFRQYIEKDFVNRINSYSFFIYPRPILFTQHQILVLGLLTFPRRPSELG